MKKFCIAAPLLMVFFLLNCSQNTHNDLPVTIENEETPNSETSLKDSLELSSFDSSLEEAISQGTPYSSSELQSSKIQENTSSLEQMSRSHETISHNIMHSSATDVHLSSSESSPPITDLPIIREENKNREELSGATLLSTADWRDSSRYIFHPDSLYTFNLLIKPNDLDRIDANPIAEEYVPGSIVFQEDTTKNVFIRYKGSEGSWWPCAKEDDADAPKQCKLSMKVKFNTDQYPDRLYYGLKKLQFHSMNHGPSYMGERFAYWAYREMGVPASRTTHVRLLINGKLEGLFLLVEQIDGRFTRYHFNDDGGNIYKHYWPLSKSNTFSDLLKTNEVEDDHSVVQNFETALNTVQNKEEYKSFIDTWGDLNILLRHVATAQAVLSYDTPFMGTWVNTQTNGHNSYSVVLPESQKVLMIPWDHDMVDEYYQHLGQSYWPELDDAWSVKGYPGCSFTPSTPYEKYWFCYPDQYATVFEELYDRVQSKRAMILNKWKEMIEPVVEEMQQEKVLEAGYPASPQTLSSWKKAVADLEGLLSDQDAVVDEVKQSIGL
ncbi:MAG: CotH kinase family protein [Fibrobacterales bacterium]